MNPDRRDFLKLAGVAGLAGMCSDGQAGPTVEQGDWMGMLTDLTLCVGCRKCEWACRKANGLSADEPIEAYDDPSVFQHSRRTDAQNFTVVTRFDSSKPGGDPTFVKRQCMHCNEPACASACLVSAFRKTPEGPVVYDESVCIGCRYCMVACPFSMPAYTYDDAFNPKVVKCSMCIDRYRESGEIPACAAICPKESITFGKRSELLELAHDKIRRRPERYIDHVYGEHEAGGTSWLYIADRPFEELGFPKLDSEPFAKLTSGFQSTVPLVLILWPALLLGASAFSRRRLEAERSGGSAVDNSAGLKGGR